MTIHIHITEDEAQTIIDGLANMAYKDVYALIPKIMEQANHPKQSSHNKESFDDS